MKMRALLIATALLIAGCSATPAQQVPLQAGPWAAGHLPMYSGSGGAQPIIQDAGTAGGGASGANPSEIGVTARGTGTAPFADQGHGPNGEIFCTYDAPTTNATGYHYLCLSPNALGGGLISYGAAGAAATLPLNFLVNGTLIEFTGGGGGGGAPVPTFSDNLTSTGNNQGTALALTSTINAFTTVAASTGTILPTTYNSLPIATGYTLQIVNSGANALTVYPPVGESINDGAGNAPVTIYMNATAQFIFRGTGAWYAR